MHFDIFVKSGINKKHLKLGQRLVQKSIQNGDSTLEKHLMSKVGTYTKKADEQAIKQTFSWIKTI